MSELKAGVLVTPHNEGMCFDRGSDVMAVTERETEFYLKSEADKVIAELNDDNFKMEKLFDARNSRCIELQKQIRHHKYKRCLAMAKYCEAMCGHYLSYEEPKWFWYRKWHMHWLALAEEPTWAKFLQLIHKETAK